MSLQDSEFIIFKSEYEVKEESEIREESMVEKVLEIRTDTWLTNEEEAKCGEIFVSNSGTFTLICANCNDSFKNMRSFGEHIHNKHLNNDWPVLRFDAKSKHSDNADSRGSDNFCSSDETEFTKDPFEDIRTSAAHFRTKHLNADRSEFNFEAIPDHFDSVTALKASDKVCSLNRTETSTDPKWFCEICNIHYKLKSSLTRHNKRHKGKKPKSLDTSHAQTTNENALSESLLHNKRYKTENSTILESRANQIANADALTKSVGIPQHNKRYKSPTSVEAESDQIINALPESTVSTSSSTKLEPLGDPRFYCEICNRQYKSKRKFQCHAMRHDTIPIALQQDPNYLKCKYCNSQFVDYSEWTEHKKTHKGEQTYYPCSHCQKTFKQRNDCEMHINSHTGEKPFKCTQCPKAFAHTSNLAWHVKRIHLQIQSYACDLCDRRFTCSVEKKIHMRQHTGEKPYQCESCGKSFMLAAYMNEHRKRHANVKDVKCTTCEKCFYSKKRLRDHMVTHSGERPHICAVCGRTFAARNALITHKKLHMDVKEYMCPICGMAFAQAAGLYSHKKSHGIIIGT